MRLHSVIYTGRQKNSCLYLHFLYKEFFPRTFAKIYCKIDVLSEKGKCFATILSEKAKCFVGDMSENGFCYKVLSHSL